MTKHQLKDVLIIALFWFLLFGLIFWAASGCVTVQRGAVQIGPDTIATPTPSTPVVPRETESGEPPAWWDNEALWATVLSTIGIVGHRIYSQRRGAYAKGHT